MYGSQNNGNTVDLCKALGLPPNATPNEIDVAYQEKMHAYRRQQHTQSARTIPPFTSIMLPYTPHVSRVSRVPRFAYREPDELDSVMNENGYYYTKSVVSTLKDGVFKRQVKENVNGRVKEYEEQYTDVPHTIRAPPAKRKHIRWED